MGPVKDRRGGLEHTTRVKLLIKGRLVIRERIIKVIVPASVTANTRLVV